MGATWFVSFNDLVRNEFQGRRHVHFVSESWVRGAGLHRLLSVSYENHSIFTVAPSTSSDGPPFICNIIRSHL